MQACPPEILDHILLYATGSSLCERERKTCLSTAALCCRALCPVAQALLFHTITLECEETCAQLLAFGAAGRPVAAYVRELVIFPALCRSGALEWPFRPARLRLTAQLTHVTILRLNLERIFISDYVPWELFFAQFTHVHSLAVVGPFVEHFADLCALLVGAWSAPALQHVILHGIKVAHQYASFMTWSEMEARCDEVYTSLEGTALRKPSAGPKYLKLSMTTDGPEVLVWLLRSGALDHVEQLVLQPRNKADVQTAAALLKQCQALQFLRVEAPPKEDMGRGDLYQFHRGGLRQPDHDEVLLRQIDLKHLPRLAHIWLERLSTAGLAAFMDSLKTLPTCNNLQCLTFDDLRVESHLWTPALETLDDFLFTPRFASLERLQISIYTDVLPDVRGAMALTDGRGILELGVHMD